MTFYLSNEVTTVKFWLVVPSEKPNCQCIGKKNMHADANYPLTQPVVRGI